ncbi:MAG: hypothetical protein JSS72_01895 [Armatimonadetes bacterium]|nr:hypothetical protein [Armatimonadota bacterium]
MSDRFSVSLVTQIGKETTKGSPAAASLRLRSVGAQPAIKANFETRRTEGDKRPSLSLATKEWTECALTGIATYNELGYLLSSLISKPTSSALGGGVYQHTFESARQLPDDLQSFTVEVGSSTACERFSYGMVSEQDFKLNRDQVSLRGSMYGQGLQDSHNDSISLTAGPNEVQTVTLSGTGLGGTFTLSYHGATTGGLAANASASAVQTALQGLSTIGSGNAGVTGSAGGPYTVTFIGALAGRGLPLLVADGSSLTGTDAAVSVTEATRGGMAELPMIPIMPGDISLYLANSYAGLTDSANKLARSFDTELNLGDRTKPFWIQDSAVGSFAGHAEGQPKETLQLMLGADDTAMALRAAYRSGASLYFRLDAQSQQFAINGGSTKHRFLFDASVKVSAVKEFKDEQGLYALGFELTLMDDAAWGRSYVATLVNGVAAY